MPYRVIAVLLSLLVCLPAPAATQGGTMPVPLPLFPQNNWWNLDVSNAPLDSNSAAFITFIGGSGRQVHPDFGGNNEDEPGHVYGIPFIVVDGSQEKKTVLFTDYGDESDGWDPNTEQSFPFYPVPNEPITMNGWIEGGLPGNIDDRPNGDRHMLIVDKTNNHLYELYDVYYNGSQWEAASGAFFDMNTNGRRPAGWTSADASGMAILPGLVRYDEVFGPDEIRHAFRVTVQASNGHVWPASHSAGSNPSALPMGARLRLKASKDISGYAPEIQKIFRAMKKYGLIVADNGSNMYVQGTYDTRWNNDVLNPAFHSLRASDFEVVQRGWQPAVTFVLSLPASVGAGDATSATLTAYDSNYNVATGYTGTVQFTSTDGSSTLPLNFTFTGADAGVHTFTNGFTLRTPGSHIVTVRDVAVATNTTSVGVSVGPPTPTGLVANAVGTTQVSLSWAPSTGATQYQVLRNGVIVGTTGSTSFNDTTVSANTTYVYFVRALDAASRASGNSAPDIATTIAFTDNPLVAGSTKVKLVHVTELRNAVNSVRAVAGLGAATFTGGSVVQAVHVTELRNALNAARVTLGLSALTFTDASPTLIKATHFQEIRNGV
ncbi:MAG TPA: fibronectin type III domain-containing protein [Thermoanaerobaculia bacterium]|nr:fibronectin type III domain-containing protein [Thermoanaerobaculia bacterium]